LGPHGFGLYRTPPKNFNEYSQHALNNEAQTKHSGFLRKNNLEMSFYDVCACMQLAGEDQETKKYLMNILRQPVVVERFIGPRIQM
jgi:hypothetical protein